MREEACVTIRTARLLGFSRGECIEGHERGLVLVRSIWRADITLDDWTPEFEITHRQIVPAARAIDLALPGFRRFWFTAFAAAGLPTA